MTRSSAKSWKESPSWSTSRRFANIASHTWKAANDLRTPHAAADGPGRRGSLISDAEPAPQPQCLLPNNHSTAAHGATPLGITNKAEATRVDHRVPRGPGGVGRESKI